MKKSETKSFEEALTELENIVRTLEAGKADLDESLAAFEEGIKLVKYCNAKLTKAEQKVRVLMQNEEGETVETDFLPAEGS